MALGVGGSEMADWRVGDISVGGLMVGEFAAIPRPPVSVSTPPPSVLSSLDHSVVLKAQKRSLFLDKGHRRLHNNTLTNYVAQSKKSFLFTQLSPALT